jgi:hypothetical protein
VCALFHEDTQSRESDYTADSSTARDAVRSWLHMCCCGGCLHGYRLRRWLSASEPRPRSC